MLRVVTGLCAAALLLGACVFDEDGTTTTVEDGSKIIGTEDQDTDDSAGQAQDGEPGDDAANAEDKTSVAPSGDDDGEGPTNDDAGDEGNRDGEAADGDEPDEAFGGGLEGPIIAGFRFSRRSEPALLVQGRR